jgi:polar amino acid transport system substrate-binding protein
MKLGRAALIASVVAVAGCGSTSNQALHSSLAALRTTTPAASSSSGSTRTVRCADSTASLRPRGALPAPGAMPAGSYMAAIKRRGHLIAGVDQNTLFLGYRNPANGKLEGAEIDLLREIARALFGDPSKVEFKALSTAQRPAAVQKGIVDLVADAFTINCERIKQYYFSSAYYEAAQRVLVPKTSKATSIRDLAHKRLCATAGSTTIQTLAKLPYHLDLDAVAQRTDCLVALQQGDVDAVSSDDDLLLGLKVQDPYTKIIGPPIAPEPYGIAISQAHPEFVRFVNGVLARMRSDGRLSSIYRQWLGPHQKKTPSPPRAHYRD